MKRNLLKIPVHTLERIRTFDQDDVVVACTKLLTLQDIPRHSHLGLRMERGELVLPGPRVPDPKAGRFSRANVEGYVKVRKDLPMIQKTFSVETPNWGDWSNGSHTIDWTRDVYQRDFYPPKEVELSISLLEKRGSGYLVKFAIEQVINRRTKNFRQELLYNLNILQENVGAVDVFVSGATLADFTASIKLHWQIFPPGTVDEVVQKMLSGKRTVTPEQEAIIKKRVSVMSKLRPKGYIVGTDGFIRYFGAQFGDDFVIFENVRYGNAVYVMYESWQELSKKSRIELLAGPRDSFTRIEHRKGWEDRLEAMVEQYRAK